jgi:hypothetical protein
VNRTFLVKRDSTVKVAGCTEEIQASLSVVALIRSVDIRLREDQNLRAKGVPFDLRTISFEERLLARGGVVKRQ